MRMGHWTRHLWGPAKGNLGSFGKPTSRSVLRTINCSSDVAVTCSGDIPAVFRHRLERPLELLGSNNLPLFCQADQLVVHTKQVRRPLSPGRCLVGSWPPFGALHR